MLGAYRRSAGQTVELRAAERFRIADGPGNAFAKLANRIWIDCDAALAHRPVAGRHIEKDLTQAIRLQPGGEIGCLVVIGKEKLDAFESGRCCRLKAVEERQLGE